LHNTNLQRCDRMSMAHGLEVRVPFLDIEMVDHAFGLPVSMKQCGPQRVEKWILRVAAEDLLPAPIAWRAKAKFAAGSGLGAELAAFAEQQISPAEFEREREVAEGLLLRSREELLYFRLFKQMYPQSEVLQLVGRSHSV
jgi:asparagine synthase (glutamine-hydrolysing)